MGVDIYAYTKVQKLNALALEDGEAVDKATLEPIADCVRAYSNSDFPGRDEGLEDRAFYSYEECLDILSMGYGGYNFWRRELAKLAGWPAVPYEQYGRIEMREDAAAWNAESGPFWELINFSDCEGCIGPVVAAKIARDFAEHQAKADAHPDERFRERYNSMRKGFEAAANNGLIRFS